MLPRRGMSLTGDGGGEGGDDDPVALVDDQELVRTGFAMVIESADDMTVVAEAGNGAQAVDVLSRVTADVVLMDIRMPVLDGIEATRKLLARPSPPKVIALTTFDLDEYAYAALRAGASGFLLKDATARDVLSALRTIHAGGRRHRAVDHPPDARAFGRHCPVPERGGGRWADRAGAGGPGRDRERLTKRPDRRELLSIRSHGEDACRSYTGKAQSTGSSAAGDIRV